MREGVEGVEGVEGETKGQGEGEMGRQVKNG
jgi:hypothetical protein